MVPVATRTLSTADERREAVLEAGMKVFAERGLHATPTLEVARAAGISHAYLFRLFPSKDALAVAVVERGNERIHATFAAAAARARATGEDVLRAMGQSYKELLADRDLMLMQLHAHAASPADPNIRDAMRRCFERIVELVRRESGASEEEVQSFMAHGMLLNVLSALDATELDAPWARILAAENLPGC